MDKIFKALADINRRKILTILKNGDMSVNDILKYLDVTQATLSSHLAILRKAGLVEFRINGRERLYKLNVEILNKFVSELEKFIGLEKSKNIEEIKLRNIR